jgi:TRAP-type transport system small permease protein
MQTALRVISVVIEVVLSALAVFIVGMVTTEVVLRKFFGSSLIITEELARYLMVWLVFLGCALAVRDGCHIRINFLVKRFGRAVQIAVAVAANALTILFLLLLVVEGLRILPQQFYQTTITFDAYMFYFYLAIPVGSVLMILYLVPRLKEVLAGNMLEAPDLPDERRIGKC